MKTEAVLQMAATIASGILANPVMGHVIGNNWEIQMVIQQTIQNTINAVQSSGIDIEE